MSPTLKVAGSKLNSKGQASPIFCIVRLLSPDMAFAGGHGKPCRVDKAEYAFGGVRPPSVQIANDRSALRKFDRITVGIANERKSGDIAQRLRSLGLACARRKRMRVR